MTWKENTYLPYKKLKKLCSDPKEIVYYFIPLHPVLHRKKGIYKTYPAKKDYSMQVKWFD